VEQDFPKIEVPRFDKAGTPDFPLPDPAHGVPHRLPYAIMNADPYPIKALFNYRFEPLMSIADTELTRKALDQLDLIVTIDINYSDIAWYSDVILPESTYLERTDCIQQANGLKPQMFLRRQAVSPRYDTRDGAMILKQIADRIGTGDYFPYENMDELVRWQLEGTGFTMEDFDAKGFVAYGKTKIFWDRTDSSNSRPRPRKIEFKSSLWKMPGLNPSRHTNRCRRLRPGKFRLVTGRNALHTHISTQNVEYLNELCGENVLWINAQKAARTGHCRPGHGGDRLQPSQWKDAGLCYRPDSP
jgi:thiosulfate reductase/polysulfide reductase chain A